MLALLLALSLQATAVTAEPADLRLPFDEFKKLYDRGEILVVDVRADGAYNEGHIPGAVRIGVDDIEANVPELKAEKRPIVTYCS
jgi:rhodanese-related sulfurtransferase